MRFERSRTIALLAATVAVVTVGACGPGPGGSAADEPLVTEEIGGAIDAELSTEEDTRGPRWVGSGSVLPPGFPVDLPLVSGMAVTEAGATGDGDNFVIFQTRDAAEKLAADWTELLEAEGWQVSRPSATRLAASRSGRRVLATIEPSGPGALLRIVYP